MMSLNKCCLFVNDDPADQAVFTQALRDVAPETLCFTLPTAEDALHIMLEENIIPSYILIESKMQRMDAIEFLNTIKGIDGLKEIPVIVHSISPEPNQIIELKESGALAIYFRPYEYWGVCNLLNIYFGMAIPVITSN